MSTAEQIIAEVVHEHTPMRDNGPFGDDPWTGCAGKDCADWPGGDDEAFDAHVAAHVVAALTNAGRVIVEPTSLSLKLWRLLGDECDEASEPNYEEDNYDAGFIAGLAHAQETIRAQLPTLLAAARVAESGDQP